MGTGRPRMTRGLPMPFTTGIVSRVASQVQVVSVSWHASLVKDNILIRHPQCAGCLYVSKPVMLNIYTVAELFPPLLSVCIVTVHHWLGDWFGLDTLTEHSHALTQSLLCSSASCICRAGLFVSSRLTNFVNCSIQCAVEFSSSCWQTLRILPMLLCSVSTIFRVIITEFISQ